jgi:hypothetical protein
VLALLSCGGSSTDEPIKFSYALSRDYTGEESNVLTIVAGAGAEKQYEFSLGNSSSQMSVTSGAMLPMKNQEITFTFTEEAVYGADFKVQKTNGQPVLFEVLNWEYSLEQPEPPVVSFKDSATNKNLNNLLVSDSREDNVTEIWIGGDITAADLDEDGGYWVELASTATFVPVTLSSGDGVKTIKTKYKNAFGNISDPGIVAQITFKQTASTSCDAVVLASTTSDGRVSLLMSVTDSFQAYFTVIGDLKQAVDAVAFNDGETVYFEVSSSAGTKNLTVYIEDVAGNFCLDKQITITVDPTYVGEGISVDGATYWVDSENITIDVLFKFFPEQGPLQMEITGNVSGVNTNNWVAHAPDLAISLSPTTSGLRTIFAQYKDVDGQSSYKIAKRIYLKPQIVYSAPNVTVSNIPGVTTLTINGCTQAYTDVDWTASYTCTPNAATVDVVYKFEDGSSLTKSTTP